VSGAAGGGGGGGGKEKKKEKKEKKRGGGVRVSHHSLPTALLPEAVREGKRVSKRRKKGRESKDKGRQESPLYSLFFSTWSAAMQRGK